MYPQIIEVKIKIPIIKKLIFRFFLFLNKNANPRPALQISPERAEAKYNDPWTYKFVIITLDAQFGINPIKEETKGVSNLNFNKKLEIVSSPIK